MIMNMLIAFIPMIGWGFMPVVAKKNNGNSYETMIGTTSFVLLSTFVIHLLNSYSYTMRDFLICFLSGVFWGFGQWFQFESMNYIHVSEAMPISNGTQLVFTSLTSWFILKEWEGWQRGIISIVSLSVVVIGIYFINRGNSQHKSSELTKAVSLILASSMFLTLYVSITNIFDISGGKVFFPQAIGMMIVSLLITFAKRDITINRTIVLKNWLTGFLWLIANISIFYSTQLIGLGLAYSISQLCVIVSIVGGIVILGEKREAEGRKNLIIGSLLMVVGIIVIGLNK